MLELLGRGYVVEFCMAELEELSYKTYVTDALKVLIDNVAKIGGGSVLKKRYVETLPKVELQEQDTTEQATEIIERIKKGVNAL